MLGSDNAARCRALRGFENESIDHIRVDLSRIFNSLLEVQLNNAPPVLQMAHEEICNPEQQSHLAENCSVQLRLCDRRG
jgi:hypothetical protein